MAFEAVREKFPGSTVEHTVTEGAGQRGSKGHFAVLCVGDWERICAGGSKAEPRYALLSGQTKEFESSDSVCT